MDDDDLEEDNPAEAAAEFLRGGGGKILPPDQESLARMLVWSRHPAHLHENLPKPLRLLLWEATGQVMVISTTIPPWEKLLARLRQEAETGDLTEYGAVLQIVFYALQLGYQLGADEAAGEIVLPK